MKSIPFFWFDTSSDGIMCPLFWDGIASCDWDKQPVSSAFEINLIRDLACCFPFLSVAGYILCLVLVRNDV